MDRNSKGQWHEGFIPWNKGIKQVQTADEKHPRWKGDLVGYRGLHYWVERKLGKASFCTQEDKTCKGMFEWANMNGVYTRNLTSYQSMCRSHHRRFDNKQRGYANNVKRS